MQVGRFNRRRWEEDGEKEVEGGRLNEYPITRLVFITSAYY